MSIRTIGRLGVVAVAVAGLLAATALPASPVVHNIQITASSTVAIGTTNTHMTSGHATTNICAVNSQGSTVVLDLNSTGGGTMSGATNWHDFHTGTSSNFEERWIITAGTLIITATSITIVLSMQIEFANCGSTPIVCRTNVLTLVSSGANPSGSVHPGASTATTLSGVSTVVSTQIGCNSVVRAAINGFTGTYNWNVHIVT